jgi:acyl-CoA synthetase (AMP-forming)/AMP-acid ligase II
MTTNVSFVLLDAAVISGRGEEPVVAGGMTHARLLEEVAAVGGVLRHLGVGRGVPVVIDLEPDLEAVVAALATARLGGVVTTADDPDSPVLVVSARSTLAAAGRPRLVSGSQVAEPDLEWNLMLRAGRTDPAACERVDPGSAYSPARSVAEQIDLLATTRAPYQLADLRALLQV